MSYYLGNHMQQLSIIKIQAVVAVVHFTDLCTIVKVSDHLLRYIRTLNTSNIVCARTMGARNAISILCSQCHRPLRTRIPQAQVAAIRAFHRSTSSQENKTPQYQPRDLGDFYNDLLATPLPKVAKAKTETELPDWVASGGRKEIEERAKKVFGSIEGSGYQSSVSKTPDATWKTINGVPIPPRPMEPDNCCMSGCVQ